MQTRVVGGDLQKKILFPTIPEFLNRSFTWHSGNLSAGYACTNMISQVQSFLNLFRLRRQTRALNIKSFCRSTRNTWDRCSSQLNNHSRGTECRKERVSRFENTTTNGSIHSQHEYHCKQGHKANTRDFICGRCSNVTSLPQHSTAFGPKSFVNRRSALRITNVKRIVSTSRPKWRNYEANFRRKWKLKTQFVPAAQVSTKNKLNKLWKVKVYWLIDTSNNMERLFFAVILLSSSSLISKTIVLIRLISCVTTSGSPANFQRHLGRVDAKFAPKCGLFMGPWLAYVTVMHGLLLNVLAGVG